MQKNIFIEYKKGKLRNFEPSIAFHSQGIAIKVLNKMQIFLNKFESSKRNLLLNTYLDRINQLKMGLHLNQVPTLTVVPEVVPVRMNKTQREGLQIANVFHNKFERFFLDLIKVNIPTSYLEGFPALRLLSQNCSWPAAPKIICTANNHWADDVFKCYVSEKVDQGSAFKLICHGGGGKFLYSDFQNHEFSICDKYFTWGWSEYSEKCFKGFIIKTIGKKIKRSNAKHLTLITWTDWRYSPILSSIPSYEQFINKYLQDQIVFLKGLDQNVRTETLVRLHYDLGNSIKDRLSQQLDHLNFSATTPGPNFYKVLKSSKLIIGTYNCTTIVESIVLNVPTIIFWETSHWELIASAIPFFEKLRRCGIFHDSPQSAANQVNAIWGCVEDWWNSTDVQDAKNEFKAWFGRDSQDPFGDILRFLES